jgi:hypothetical protein
MQENVVGVLIASVHGFLLVSASIVFYCTQNLARPLLSFVHMYI